MISKMNVEKTEKPKKVIDRSSNRGESLSVDDDYGRRALATEDVRPVRAVTVVPRGRKHALSPRGASNVKSNQNFNEKSDDEIWRFLIAFLHLSGPPNQSSC